MKKSLYLFISCGILSLAHISCNKKATVSTPSIIQTNTVVNSPSPLTLFLVRHAEKQEGSNPSLTESGKQRATELARFLDKVSLDAIYSSDYKRTKETALPTANKKNISIVNYDPGQLQKVATDLLVTQSGKTILLIGHSNTNPELINIFTQTKDYPHLTEKQYDDIFLLRVNSLGATEVLHFNYGKPSE